MILTCPACDTKYVVKDDAIPPQGRQVRCASCKHSWHQDPELVLAEPAADLDFDLRGSRPDETADAEYVSAEAPTVEPAAVDSPEPIEGEGEIAAEPQQYAAQTEDSPWGAVADEPVAAPVPPAEPAGEVAMEEAPAIADEWRAPIAAEPAEAVEEEFVGYSPIDDGEQESRRRWPVILGIILLVAAAATAFWFFAPPEWKERAGIAPAGSSQLQLLITTRERQPMGSGQELVLLGGRIINPTNREQKVPPIQVQLKDPQSKAVLHRWTIDPPRSTLGPGESASFNNAEIDQPRKGDQQVDIVLGGSVS